MNHCHHIQEVLELIHEATQLCRTSESDIAEATQNSSPVGKFVKTAAMSTVRTTFDVFTLGNFGRTWGKKIIEAREKLERAKKLLDECKCYNIKLEDYQRLIKEKSNLVIQLTQLQKANLSGYTLLTRKSIERKKNDRGEEYTMVYFHEKFLDKNGEENNYENVSDKADDELKEWLLERPKAWFLTKYLAGEWRDNYYAKKEGVVDPDSPLFNYLNTLQELEKSKQQKNDLNSQLASIRQELKKSQKEKGKLSEDKSQLENQLTEYRENKKDLEKEKVLIRNIKATATFKNIPFNNNSLNTLKENLNDSKSLNKNNYPQLKELISVDIDLINNVLGFDQKYKNLEKNFNESLQTLNSKDNELAKLYLQLEENREALNKLEQERDSLNQDKKNLIKTKEQLQQTLERIRTANLNDYRRLTKQKNGSEGKTKDDKREWREIYFNEEYLGKNNKEYNLLTFYKNGFFNYLWDASAGTALWLKKIDLLTQDDTTIFDANSDRQSPIPIEIQQILENQWAKQQLENDLLIQLTQKEKDCRNLAEQKSQIEQQNKDKEQLTKDYKKLAEQLSQAEKKKQQLEEQISQAKEHLNDYISLMKDEVEGVEDSDEEIRKPFKEKIKKVGSFVNANNSQKEKQESKIQAGSFLNKLFFWGEKK